MAVPAVGEQERERDKIMAEAMETMAVRDGYRAEQQVGVVNASPRAHLQSLVVG
jgi:hypothetical protein